MAHHDDMTVAEALKEYVEYPDKPAREIAKKYGVSKGTLTVWAKNAKIKLRGRGRDKQRQPDARTREILEHAQVATGDQTGLHFGITKQRVSKILKRWKNWQQPRKSPFLKDEIIEWKGKFYTVVVTGIYIGTVRDNENGEIVHNFHWTMDGHSARKVVPKALPKASPVQAKLNGHAVQKKPAAKKKK